jgi:protein-S-isoprenylcysteine O-methyltransferase Ste14
MRKRRTRLRLLFAVCLLLLGHPHHEGWEAGMTLLALGAGLHALAAGYLRKNRLLCAAGPYRFVRNPFYVADFLRDLGLLLACHACVEPRCLPLWIFAWLYFGVMFGVVIRGRVRDKEEPRLLERFGAAYAAYCEAVPRFVPRLRPAPALGDARFSLAALVHNRELPRLLATLLTIGLTYYRWEAFHHDFALARMLDDRWELALLPGLVVLLLLSKIRLSALSEGWAPRLAVVSPWLLAGWLAALPFADYREYENDLVAWGVGLLLVAVGCALRFAARLERRRARASGEGLATQGVYSCLRHPSAVGTTLAVLGLTTCSQALWLLPVALGLCVALLAPVVSAQETELLSSFGGAFRSWARGRPRFWPRRRWRSLVASVLVAARSAPLPLLRSEAAVLAFLVPLAAFDLVR